MVSLEKTWLPKRILNKFLDLICLLFPALPALILASLFVLAKREKPLRGQKIEFWDITNKLQLLQAFLFVAAVVSFVWRQIAAKIYRSLESSLLREIKIIRIHSHKTGSVTGYNDGLLIQTNSASYKNSTLIRGVPLSSLHIMTISDPRIAPFGDNSTPSQTFVIA
jgi:hypothetical protein